MVLRRSRKLCLIRSIKLCLYINTADKKNITVALKKDGRVVKSLSEENEYGSQALLPLIIKLLRGSNPGLSVRFQSRIGNELEGIEVETGPGSFTGLRVGVSVANALGFALGIAVNGKKMETELQY